MTRREGIEPEEAMRFFGPMRRWFPPVLTLATLPARLSGRAERQQIARARPAVTDAERAAFVLRSVVAQLGRTLARLEPRPRSSEWSGYMTTRTHYSQGEFEAKARFVRTELERIQPARVLDVGCNTGYFSELAARSGASVVAIDADPAVVGALWRKADAEALDVLPLVVNLGRPSPAVGWRNRESESFLARANGRFELVLMLAVVHHLLVTERIPLRKILGLAAELTRQWLLIEYVGPDDPMFRRLARGRDHLFAASTREAFEAACRDHFLVRRVECLQEGRRWLYLLEKPLAIR